MSSLRRSLAALPPPFLLRPDDEPSPGRRLSSGTPPQPFCGCCSDLPPQPRATLCCSDLVCPFAFAWCGGLLLLLTAPGTPPRSRRFCASAWSLSWWWLSPAAIVEVLCCCLAVEQVVRDEDWCEFELALEAVSMLWFRLLRWYDWEWGATWRLSGGGWSMRMAAWRGGGELRVGGGDGGDVCPPIRTGWALPPTLLLLLQLKLGVCFRRAEIICGFDGFTELLRVLSVKISISGERSCRVKSRSLATSVINW